MIIPSNLRSFILVCSKCNHLKLKYAALNEIKNEIIRHHKKSIKKEKEIII